MAMAVTITEEPFGAVQKVRFAFTSASDGTASGATNHAYTGVVERVVVQPGSAGNQPTNLFDVTVTDEDGADVLAGAGANLSNAAATWVASGLGAAAGDRLTLNVANAGDTKQGAVTLYLRA